MRTIDDADTLQRLLTEHCEWVHAYVQHKMPPELRSRMSAEDLCQQIWLKAFATRSRFRSDGPDAFERWLLMIVNNCLLERLRDLHAEKRGGGTLQVSGDVLDPSGRTLFERCEAASLTPSKEFARLQKMEALRAELAELPEEQRTAVILHHFEGHSIKESAHLMGYSLCSVKGLIQRGLASLHKKLKGWYP